MNDNSQNGAVSDRLDALRMRLYSIVCIEGLDRHSGQEARKLAVDNFLEDMFQEVSISQSIIKKNLNSDDQDFIKYWVAHQIAEKILEDSASVVVTESSVSVKMLTVKVYSPKNI